VGERRRDLLHLHLYHLLHPDPDRILSEAASAVAPAAAVASGRVAGRDDSPGNDEARPGAGSRAYGERLGKSRKDRLRRRGSIPSDVVLALGGFFRVVISFGIGIDNDGNGDGVAPAQRFERPIFAEAAAASSRVDSQFVRRGLGRRRIRRRRGGLSARAAREQGLSV